jgi:hypothetical protein
MRASFFWKKDASLAINAKFKTAQLLPEQLFAGCQFAESFNQSSKTTKGRVV